MDEQASQRPAEHKVGWLVELTEEEREFLLDSFTELEKRLAEPVVVQGFPIPLKKQQELVRDLKKKLQ